MSGLIYQVAWIKALGLIFGHSLFAIATVLAVFMAGLATGSAYLGRWRSQVKPVVLYAYIELLIAATGLLSLVGLRGVGWLYVKVYPDVGNFPALLLALRFFGAVAVLFIPTFLMGGTLPILARVFARNSDELGVGVSQLYWINTLGAVVGTVMSGFILLPAFGLRGTIAIAVALNVVAGFVAFRIPKSLDHRQYLKNSEVVTPSPVSAPPPSLTPLLLLFAVVGCTAFTYEIAWTRLLSITISSSTYAFTTMLAMFLTGIVLGSVSFKYFVVRSPRISLITFSKTQTWIGIAALSTLVAFHWLLPVIPFLLRATDRTFGGLLLAQFVISGLTVLPVATIFGFAFPMVIALFAGTASSNDSNSAIVGSAYAANTVGSIVGSLAAGFWLVPSLGSFRVIAAAAGVNLLVAAVTSRRRVLFLALNMLLLVAAFLVGSSSFLYNRALFSLSSVLYGTDYQGRLTLNEIAATSDLVFAKDGVNDSVAVSRSDNYVALRINGKVDASTGDERTQLLLGHLGAAFDPPPRRVLIIGFGSGMTASAVARYPDVERIDCVEIEPAVINASPFLDSLNRDVLSDPRVHVIFDDARNFLLTTHEKYDLIISEPSNPWIAGVATLFTDEFYAAVRRTLAPGGKLVQWLQSYSLAPTDLKMVVATLVPHCSDVTLWRAAGPDLLLLARSDNTQFKFSRLRSLWQNKPLRDDFESVDVHEPEGLAAYFLLDDAALRKMSEGAAVNTDDRTLLEYHAPRTVLTSNLYETNKELIDSFRSGPLPVNLDSSDVSRALLAGSRTAIDLSDPITIDKFLGAVESRPDSSSKDFVQGLRALTRGAFADSIASFKSALDKDPTSLDTMHWLAVAEHRNGDDASARVRIDEILRRNPNYLPALTDKMEFAVAREAWGIALLAQLNRMAVIPDPPASEFCRLGAIWMKTANMKEAEPVLLRGLAKDPYSYACHLQLGELYRQSDQFPLARQHFEFVVRFYPDSNASVFASLASVYLNLGDAKAADAIVRKGRRIFPTESR
ncbi:MAG TPA: fused MFS/spermidine synthase [Candidatus Acidoferrum sp.]